MSYSLAVYTAKATRAKNWNETVTRSRDRIADGRRQTSAEANMSATMRDTGILPSVDRKYKSSMVSALTERSDANIRSSLPKRNG